MNIELLNFKQAAEFLNVKESWLRMAVFRQDIPVIKCRRLLRFRKKDLEYFINNNIRGVIEISADLHLNEEE